MEKALKRLLYCIFSILILSVIGCATSSDLKAVRTEVNQQMEEKLAAADARMAAMQKEQEKQAATLASMRKGQANTTADFTELREQIQQLRGQVEALKKETARDSKKDDEFKEKIDALLLKINFIENFLEISKKDSAGDVVVALDNSLPGKDSTGKPDKAVKYAAAYQLFKAGNYIKARESFQAFLALYPSGEYSDNAQFWIGECYFFEKKYEKAILEYEKVTKKFTSSSKVPYALLKQGISFQNLGDKTSARLLLQQVIKDYPNTSQARIARSKLQEIK